MKPRIFISTVSSELGSIRQLTANVLTRLGYEPVWQDIFGTEPGDLKQMLRAKIDECVGLIQIVGRGYGAEPPQPDPEFGRVSYTQYELLYAQARGKKTWVLFAEDGCLHDRPLEKLDLPPDPDHPDPAIYQAERRALQDSWRLRLRQDSHLWHAAASNTELELKLERLKDEFSTLRRGFRRWQGVVVGLGIAALLLLGCTLIALRAVHKQVVKVQEGQTITAASIRVRLEESSEKARDAELAQAEKEFRFDEREKLRSQATKGHEIRLSRIHDLADSFVELEQRSDSSPVLREMTRILSEEKTNPVDKAIAYAEGQRVALLDRVRGRKRAEQERNRTDLIPLLKAAELEQNRGRSAAARKQFAEVLELEPNWPQALESFAYFLFDQSVQTGDHGSLRVALDDAHQSFELAERLFSQDKTEPASQRVFSVACNQLGDLLVKRGSPGDSEQALRHFTRCLEIDEGLRKQNPDSALAARDVYVGLERLGNFLALRGQPGDAENALRYLTRSLELAEALQKQNPDSALAARDLAMSLNKLGAFLAQRGQPGDAEEALQHFTRCFEICEALQKQNPDSAQAARDLSVSLNSLANFLAQRGQPGDAENALRQFTREFEISEALQKQNPDSAQAARDLSISLNKLGDLLAQRGQPGDAEKALQHLTRSLEIREALQKQNPDSALAARDVSISLEMLGGFLAQRGQSGDAEKALQHLTRSLEIREALQKQNPDSAQAARDLSFSIDKLGGFFAHRGQPGDAEAAARYVTRSLDIRENLLKQNPGSAHAAHDVSFSLSARATALAKLGRLTDVAQAGAKLRGLEPKSAINLYKAACAYGLAAGLAVNAKMPPTPVDQAARKKLVDLALACLKEAIAGGFDDFNQMKQDTDLTPLHGLPEFESLFPKPAGK
jgi:tetratricopeptide (TPR) repeat protein